MDLQLHLKTNREFDKKFELINPKFKELLLQMLTFNPQERLSADQLLKNPIFNFIRNKRLEDLTPKKVSLIIDKPGVFDYEENKNH